MSKIYQIALNTFREAVRDRILYVLVFFAALMMLASKGLGWVSVGQEGQIVQHFSLAVVSLFGALVAVFVGTGLIHKEIDKRTIYMILSKPVERWQFVLGKFCGLAGVLFCVVFGMGGLACLFSWLAGAGIRPIYLEALALTYCEMLVVTSLAILFSAVTSPILAAIFTFCAYLIGQVTGDLVKLANMDVSAESLAAKTGEHLTDAVSQTHWFWKPLAQVFYHLLPNLSHFQLRNRVVYGPPLDQGSYFLDGEFLQAVMYAGCYSLAVLIVAILIFDRNRF